MCIGRREDWCRLPAAVARWRRSSCGHIRPAGSESEVPPASAARPAHRRSRRACCPHPDSASRSSGAGRPSTVTASIFRLEMSGCSSSSGRMLHRSLAGREPGFAGAGQRAGRLRSAVKLRRLAALIGSEDAQGKRLLPVRWPGHRVHRGSAASRRRGR